jgi:hypothetical protein
MENIPVFRHKDIFKSALIFGTRLKSIEELHMRDFSHVEAK